MNKLTVVMYYQDEPPLETPWTSTPAAIAFAAQVMRQPQVVAVRIWVGDNPQGWGDPWILEAPELLYSKSKPGRTFLSPSKNTTHANA